MADSPPTPAPRSLIVFWCLWLLGSWLVTLSLDSAVPGVRWMIMSCVFGLLLFWPVVRLSQDHAAVRARRLQVGQTVPRTADAKLVLLDWLSLNAVFQVVIWPMRLYADWRLEQTLWVIVGMGAYSLLSGLAVAWGLSSGGWGRWPTWMRRVLAMIACVLILFGEPLVLAVVSLVNPDATPWTFRLSPIQAMWELTAPPAVFQVGDWPGIVLTVAAAAAVGWLVLAAMFSNGHERSDVAHHELLP